MNDIMNERRKLVGQGEKMLLSLDQSYYDGDTIDQDPAEGDFYMDLMNNSTIIKDSEVEIEYSSDGDFVTITYDSSTGQVHFLWEANHDLSNSRDGFLHIWYKGEEMAISLHQQHDYITDEGSYISTPFTLDATLSGPVDIQSATANRLANGVWGTSAHRFGSCAYLVATGPECVVKAYASGKVECIYTGNTITQNRTEYLHCQFPFWQRSGNYAKLMGMDSYFYFFWNGPYVHDGSIYSYYEPEYLCRLKYNTQYNGPCYVRCLAGESASETVTTEKGNTITLTIQDPVGSGYSKMGLGISGTINTVTVTDTDCEIEDSISYVYQ